jgi:hypothetical protein
MIRLWYRSRLFWLGVPGLLFLLWGWYRVEGKQVIATLYVPDSSRLRLLAGDGCLTLYHLDLSRTNAAKRGWDVEWREAKGGKGAVAKPMRVGASPDDPILGRTRYIVSAMWFVVVLYGFGWAAVLVLWQRRKARVLKLSAAPPP